LGLDSAHGTYSRRRDFCRKISDLTGKSSAAKAYARFRISKTVFTQKKAAAPIEALRRLSFEVTDSAAIRPVRLSRPP
jgi:hypothetical protein